MFTESSKAFTFELYNCIRTALHPTAPSAGAYLISLKTAVSKSNAAALALRFLVTIATVRYKSHPLTPILLITNSLQLFVF